MTPVIVVYFCYGWTLWLFLSWIPSFFKNEYHLDLQNSALFASGVFFAGVVGDTLGGIVSDRLFTKTKNLNIARRNLVAVIQSPGEMVAAWPTTVTRSRGCAP